MRQLTIKRGDEMKKIFFILMAITFMGCTHTSSYEPIDYQPSETEMKQPEDPLKFSNDPLLKSVYRDRYLKSLKNLSEEDDD